MSTFLTEIRETIVPVRGSRHGPLPPLLLSMTLVTGLVDSFSYLVLGHVFVANMTGNVVFLAFALAGAQGFSIPTSLAALASFGLGAAVAGRVSSRLDHHRARLLSTCTTIQAVLVAAAVVLTALSQTAMATWLRYCVVVLLGVAMGIQNGAARKLAVPDLTTTVVITATITDIAADCFVAGGSGARAGRRWLVLMALFVGALVGAVLVVNTQRVYALVIALVVVTAVAVASRLLGSANPAWIHLDG